MARSRAKPGASAPDTVPGVPNVPPDYTGRGLLNVAAELELRLTGSALAPGLDPPDALPRGEGYVLVVIDGLGADRVPGSLRAAHRGTLEAGFPTTTTTSLSTLVTGTAPTGHGVIGHVLYLPPVAEAVNVLKWVTPDGRNVTHDYASVLPAPNLWERLAAAGVEPITVQPGPFMGSPLSRMLYRGCRFEPAWTVEELVTVTVDVARPGRLVLTYFPDVDVAAHVEGQGSKTHRRAIDTAAFIWESLATRLPDDIGLVGTADHGLIDYAPADKIMIRDRRYDPLRFFGDPRSVYVSGPDVLIDELVAETEAISVPRDELRAWLGPGPAHPELESRLPDRLLLAPTGKLLLPRPFDKRLIGYHGGLERAEVEVPLLTRD